MKIILFKDTREGKVRSDVEFYLQIHAEAWFELEIAFH
jgi:hypothetical protein